MNSENEEDIKISNKLIKILSHIIFKKIYTTTDLIIFNELINSLIKMKISVKNF